MAASAFILSLASPVWKAKLCHPDWKGGVEKPSLILEPNARGSLECVLALFCGCEVAVTAGFSELIDIGQFADSYGIENVSHAVQDEILRQLTVQNCAEVMLKAAGRGLDPVEHACRSLALSDFERFARSEGFMHMGEEAVGSLLDSDMLQAAKEERVWEAAARWMRVGQGEGERGAALLGKVRFRRMAREYLEGLLRPTEDTASWGCCSAALSQLAAEALSALAPVAGMRQCEATAGARAQKQVAWGRYLVGAEQPRRLEVGSEAFAVAVCGGRVWVGGWDGRMRGWDRATLGQVVTAAGHKRAVCALAAWGEWVVSGSADGGMRAWDGETGRCGGELEGAHLGGVSALLVRRRWHGLSTRP